MSRQMFVNLPIKDMARSQAFFKSLGDDKADVLKNAGATPWNRDLVDRRIVANVIEGRGEIIDSEEQVGGYPRYAPTQKPFDQSEWQLDTMEPVHPFQQAEPPR